MHYWWEICFVEVMGAFLRRLNTGYSEKIRGRYCFSVSRACMLNDLSSERMKEGSWREENFGGRAVSWRHKKIVVAICQQRIYIVPFIKER